MDSSQTSDPLLLTVIRWTARVLSVLIIMTMLFFFIGEGVSGDTSPNARPLNSTDIIQLVLAGIELVGLALAWRWEARGGSITLVAFVCKGIVNPRTIGTPLLLIPFAAILFLLSWWMSRNSHTPETPAAPSANS